MGRGFGRALIINGHNSPRLSPMKGSDEMYIQYNRNPRGNTHAGDCVIRAISVVTGDSWEKIYTELCAEGYEYGDWGSNNAVWDSYLRSRGFTRHVCPNDCPSCYTVADFARNHNHGHYIAATGSHTVACIDGCYIDAWDSGRETPIFYYRKEGE